MPLLFPFPAQGILRKHEGRALAMANPVMRAMMLCGAAAALIGCSAPALGQITHNGTSDLSAINTGDISLRGDVTNPTVSGGTSNSAGNLAAQGASTSYSINDAEIGTDGQPVGTASTASVSNTRLSGTNSGTVSVRATITGGAFAGSNNSQSVSATGLSNVISIRTTASQ